MAAKTFELRRSEQNQALQHADCGHTRKPMSQICSLTGEARTPVVTSLNEVWLEGQHVYVIETHQQQ